MLKKFSLNGSLLVSVLKEGNSYIATSPALELSSCGDSFEDALKMFEETAELFFESCIERNVLKEVLEECGWSVDKKTITPPQVLGNKLIPLELLNDKINSSKL